MAAYILKPELKQNENNSHFSIYAVLNELTLLKRSQTQKTR